MEGKTPQQIFREACACSTEDEAQEWLAGEARRVAQLQGCDVSLARCQLLESIAYMTERTDAPTANRLFIFFRTQHPVYGERMPFAEMT